MIKNKFLRALAKALAITVFWILVWKIASHFIGNEFFLPAPEKVIRKIGELAITKNFYVITAISVARVLIGIALAILLGIVLAVLTHISQAADALLRPLITVVKSTPVASFIILAFFWFDHSDLPIFIAILMVLPVVWTNLREGLTQTDKKLLEMAKVYKIGFISRLKNIHVPSLIPYFSSATKTSIGLAWKAGVATEVIALPPLSIGKKLFDAKSYFDMTELFAWTAAVVVLSLIIEAVFERIIAYTFGKRRGIRAENK